MDICLEPGALRARACSLRRQPARLQGGQRIAAYALRQRGREAGRIGERVGEQTMVPGTGDSDAAETCQMRRQELRVEQAVSAEPEPDHQMHEGDLARIDGAAEHALSEKGGAQRDAV